MPKRRTFVSLPALLLLTLTARAFAAPPTPQAPDKPESSAQQAGITPPRLSYTDGEVSFWRPGSEDWTPSRLNTPLAAGDRLYTGDDSNLELELAGQTYVRAGEQTQLGIANLEPDFVQIEITAGHASLDVRSLPAGHTVEIDTPNAAFTVESTGYYRVDVAADQTTFITRRGGQAKVTPAGGRPAAISASEQVVVSGSETPALETYVAPELDTWDRWNYARTDRLMESLSARYVPSGVAGTSDLDYYGRWRVVPTYGPIWVPTAVPSGWVPYSTGRWVYDPYYSWTWVDDAPWGWAPYHYGRWVYYNGFWAWAPGPLVVRPVYSPALVAFYSGSDFAISVGYGSGAIGWVALGWGEPCWPWWGPSHYAGRAWWGGWGGPYYGWHHRHGHKRYGDYDHDDDHDGDHHDDHDDDHDGNHGRNHNGDDRNKGYRRPVVVEREDEFGRGQGGSRRVAHLDDDKRVEPIRGSLPVKAGKESLSPGLGSAKRPPESASKRPVVATRRPHDPSQPLRKAGIDVPRGNLVPRADVVRPSKLDPGPSAAVPRPPFGTRGGAEREPPSPPPVPNRRASSGAEKADDGAPRPQRGRTDLSPSDGASAPQRGITVGGRKQVQPTAEGAGEAPKGAPTPRSWRTRPETAAPPAPPVPRRSPGAPAPTRSFGAAAPQTPSTPATPRAHEPRVSPSRRQFSQPAPRAVPERGGIPSASPATPRNQGARDGTYAAPRNRGASAGVPNYSAPRPAGGSVTPRSSRGQVESAPAPSPRGRSAPGAGSTRLPGEPANQLFRGSGKTPGHLGR